MTASADEYKAAIGQRPPEWAVAHWMNGKASTLEGLRGKAVLVRWFTAEHCPYCSASAPALNEFHEKYGGKGLAVIGFYHHKTSTPLRVEEVGETVGHYGFKFPVAIDGDWKTLRDWWLFDDSRKWTSVSFLLDRDGKIAWIHPGGQYVKGDEDYATLVEEIERVVGDIAP